MPTVDLIFTGILNKSKPADLIFNTGLNLPEPRFVEFSASIPRPTLSASVFYDNAVFRGVTSALNPSWQVAGSFPAQITTTAESIEHLRPQAKSSWQETVKTNTTSGLPFFSGIKTPNAFNSPWRLFDTHNVALQSLYRQLFKQHQITLTKYQTAAPVSESSNVHWQERIHLPRPERQSPWREGFARQSKCLIIFGKAAPLYLSERTHWEEARKPIQGRHSTDVVPPTPDERCYIPPDGGHVDFIFKDLLDGSTDLIFTCMRQITPIVTKIVPVRSTYIVINDLNLTRVDGNHDLPINNLSLNIDMSSWTWSFSASMHARALPLIEPDSLGNPTILRATINGANYLLIAETVKRDRTFGKSNISVSGRGLSATLDAPYSPARSFGNTQDRTAQQLMQDALTINGVALDWSIDWRIDDWLVPAGTFNHSGSYINALTTIANAAGAFLQPDPINQIIRVRHKVPIKPWELDLAIPEIELPSAVITKESISWSKKPDYNAVYISGTSASGILGLVKKTGTAGDLLAPMVSDALITSAVVARQRGLTVLADTGKMATYSLSLPVLAETGIIEPGTSVRYKDDKDIIGIVQGVSFSGESDSSTARTRARQTIEVLTYV